MTPGARGPDFDRHFSGRGGPGVPSSIVVNRQRGRDTMAYEAMLAETVLMRGHRGDQIAAYLAHSLGTGPYPGVVVIQHMPGWDGPTKEIARRFGHHRYVAISPNLHFREGKATPEENSTSVRAAGGMPDDRTMGDVQGAIDSLGTRPPGTARSGFLAIAPAAAMPHWAAAPLGALATP